MCINSLDTVPNDPTILHAKMIVFDFEENGKHKIITEEVASENIQTLIGKRICCKYINAEDNGGTDALGDHESTYAKDREGNNVVYELTDAIGFIENVYIDNYTDENGNVKRVVFADATLWNDNHYKDIIGLLQEWLSNGIKIIMSCEFLYYNSETVDGIEYIKSPICFVAHTILNSEDRGECIEIAPSYECATLLDLNSIEKYNKAVCQLDSNIKKKKDNNQLKEDNKNSMENLYLKVRKENNQLSFGDIRDKLYEALAEKMTEDEYCYTWISLYDTYSSTFIYETKENNEYAHYKVNYTLDSTTGTVTIDYENKVKVERIETITYVEVNSLNELKENNSKLTEENTKLKSEKNSLEGKIKEMEEVVQNKENNQADNTAKLLETIGSLNKQISELNSQVVTMKPMVDAYNKSEFEKALNSALTKYKEMFTNINAGSIFETNSTQELIKQTVSLDVDVKNKAINELNQLMVDNIKAPLVSESSDDTQIQDTVQHLDINQIDNTIKDNNSLVNEDFEEKYGLDRYN